MPKAHRKSADVLFRYTSVDDWAVMSISALYGASATAYARKTGPEVSGRRLKLLELPI